MLFIVILLWINFCFIRIIFLSVIGSLFCEYT